MSDSSRGLLSKVPLFIWALALYPIAHLAVSNPGQAPFSSVAGVLFAIGMFATVVLLAARSILSSWTHAGLLTGWALVAFFAYGPLHGGLEDAALLAIEQGRNPTVAVSRLHTLLSMLAIATIGIAWFLIRRLSSDKAGRITHALNVFGLILLSFVGVRALYSTLATGIDTSIAANSTAAVHQTAGPDIYYVILDGYARRDVLKQYYDFDNGPFIESLEQRGFFVAPASNSNYYWTFLSLASSLNFDFLDNVLPAPTASNDDDRTAAYEAIRRSKTAMFLRERGYRIVHLQSTWGATRSNPYADIQIDCRGGIFHDEFVRSVLDTTWLKAFSDRAASDIARCHQSNFASLAGLGSMPGPKFVLAHFLPPHHPYLFDRDGTIRHSASLSDQFDFQKRLWEQRDDYRRQLEYVNAQIIEAIDRIVASSTKPPVIVLQSDHGPNLRRGLGAEEQLRIRFANLVAMRLPGEPAAIVSPTIEPVNVFRIVLDRYFDANLPLLPGRQFTSPYARPFELCEVFGIDSPILRFDADDKGCAALPRARSPAAAAP